MTPATTKLKLHGFNNLTKSLSFNLYDICYASDEAEQRRYMEYIHGEYNAERLTGILETVVRIIGANILNVARQDYDPLGASVTMLIAEEPLLEQEQADSSASPGPLPEAVVAHLDKSHITVHTYPEAHPHNGICTFRADIDVATCGIISPLKALNFLIHSFESDIVTMDYRVRGFTRAVSGQKLFIDHRIDSIQDFLSDDTREAFQMIDVNVYEENLFHTKMMLKEFELSDYLFASSMSKFTPSQQEEIARRLKQEMTELFYGRNLGGAD